MQKILFVILLVIICVRPALFIFAQLPNLSPGGYKDQYENLKRAYYNSQYVKKQNPGIIPDETLESFAGGTFLKGLNPILIVHDQPPLGRYSIALSILLFDNASTIPAVLLIFAALGVYLVANGTIENSLAALVPVGLFINEPLFLEKFRYIPLLEPIQLPFIVFSLYFFIRGVSSKNYVRWFLLCSLMLGFVISIRYFVLGAVLLISMLLSLMLSKSLHKRIPAFLAALPISVVVLILSYTKTVLSGYSILHVFGIQKYIFLYHKSKFILPFTFWDLFLFNKWHTWWGEQKISSDSIWTIVWPISFVCVILSLISALFKKIKLNNAETVVLCWIFTQVALLSTGYTSTRYFLPLVPFLYIIATSFVLRLLKLYKAVVLKR